jgi:hypothetical protein
MRFSARYIAILGTLIALVLVLAGPVSSIQAQDQGHDEEAIVGYRIIGEEISGPHLIQVQVSPKAPITGITRFAVRVRNAETGEDIDDAIVRVFTTPSEKGEKQYSPGLNSPVDPTYYLTQLDVEHPGLWAVDVEVESELGNSLTVLSIQVQGRGRNDVSGIWTEVLFGVIALSFAGGISWIVYSSKKALKRRDQQS